MPLEAPVISAAFSCANSLSLRSPSGRGHPISPLNNMARMRTGPIHRALLPACSPPARSSPAAARTTPTTTSSGPRAGEPPGAAEERLPRHRGRTARRGARIGHALRTRRLPGGDGLLQGENRYPFGVFETDRTPVTDAEVALYFAKVPEVNEKAEKPGAKGADARAEEQSAGRTGDRPVPGRGRKPRDPARLPRPDDQPTTPTPPPSSTRPRSTSPATASGGSRR